MNPSLYISLFSGIFSLSVGIYLFFRNPKSNINKIFFLFVLNIAIFNISEFLTRLSTTAVVALFWGRICYSMLALGPCFALNFSLIFPRKTIPKRYDLISKYVMACIYLIGLIVYIFFIYSTSLQDVHYSEWGYRLPISPSYFFIAIWFLVITGLIFSYLIYKYFWGDNSDIEKKQIKLVLIGAILMVITAVVTNILPPLFNLNIFPMTSLFTSIFVVFVSYTILKYKFLSLSIAMIAENIINMMKDSLIVIDQNENIVNVNKSTLDILGYHKKELINSSLNQIVKLPELGERKDKKIFESNAFKKLFTDNGPEDVEVEFLPKNGKTIPMDISVSIIYNNKKNVEGIAIVARDLTEIKKSLKEKEVLLREIHHRVKNNLQFISSLLHLQSEQIENKDIKEMFKESQNRIKLMANLHEQLYQSKSLAKINLGEYIQSLTTNLFHSYKINPAVITLKINIPDIFMDVDNTLLCSLIVNELVSNSLKHAFPAGKKGEIIIDFHLEDNTHKLTVSDTGVGFPKDVDFRNTKTLGLQLANIFVQQLEGAIKLDRTEGAKFIITFQYIRRKKKGKKDGKRANFCC